jgi:hypothetical protein
MSRNPTLSCPSRVGESVRRMVMLSPAALPERIRDVEHLEALARMADWVASGGTGLDEDTHDGVCHGAD